MKTNRIMWFFCAFPIAAMICLATDKAQPYAKPKGAPATTRAVPATAAKSSDDAGKWHVIGHLETRDKIVTIQSGAAGLRYLVKTKDGKILHENLSEEQLEAQAPEIHELIKTSVAGAPTKGGAFLDARVSHSIR